MQFIIVAIYIIYMYLHEQNGVQQTSINTCVWYIYIHQVGFHRYLTENDCYLLCAETDRTEICTSLL